MEPDVWAGPGLKAPGPERRTVPCVNWREGILFSASFAICLTDLCSHTGKNGPASHAIL